MDDEIYDHIIFLADPDLNEPVLVIALEGWIDAGLGASNAIGTMLDTIYTEVLATFDTEYFIDQRARRPIARIVDGITTELTWPEIQLRFGRDATARTSSFSWSRAGLPLERLRRRRHRRRRSLRRTSRRRPRGLSRSDATHPSGAHHRHGSGHQCPSARAGGNRFGELEVPAGISSALELGFAEVDMEIVTLWAECPTTWPRCRIPRPQRR